MLNLNRATILGNSTRDAELRTTPNGKSVASFAVATNRRYKDAAGEIKDEVQFHEIVAWGKLAEISEQIVKKGGKIYVEGRIQTRNWEGQDGARREKTEIVAENIIALSPRQGGTSSSYGSGESSFESATPKTTQTKDEPTSEKPAKEEAKEDEINLDDIPF